MHLSWRIWTSAVADLSTASRCPRRGSTDATAAWRTGARVMKTASAPTFVAPQLHTRQLPERAVACRELAALAAAGDQRAARPTVEAVHGGWLPVRSAVVVPGEQPLAARQWPSRRWDAMCRAEFQRYWSTNHAEPGRRCQVLQGWQAVHHSRCRSRDQSGRAGVLEQRTGPRRRGYSPAVRRIKRRSSSRRTRRLRQRLPAGSSASSSTTAQQPWLSATPPAEGPDRRRPPLGLSGSSAPRLQPQRYRYPALTRATPPHLLDVEDMNRVFRGGIAIRPGLLERCRCRRTPVRVGDDLGCGPVPLLGDLVPPAPASRSAGSLDWLVSPLRPTRGSPVLAVRQLIGPGQNVVSTPAS